MLLLKPCRTRTPNVSGTGALHGTSEVQSRTVYMKHILKLFFIAFAVPKKYLNIHQVISSTEMMLRG